MIEIVVSQATRFLNWLLLNFFFKYFFLQTDEHFIQMSSDKFPVQYVAGNVRTDIKAQPT